MRLDNGGRFASWEEKYRPKTLSDVAGHGQIVAELRDYIAGGDPPHLLFVGPPGTGKTSAAHAFANDYLGEWAAGNVIEWNASAVRGIDDVREKIVPFARALPFGGPRRVVILDEADGLTREAQAALKRPMEQCAANCLFVLTANSAKLDEALLSRLRVMDFWAVEPEAAAKRMLYILEREGVRARMEDLITLAGRTGGDMRKAIQSARAFAVQTEVAVHA